MRAIPPLACLLVLLLAIPCVRAGEVEPDLVLWRFRKGATTREVDVTQLTPSARAALLERLRAEGFERVDAVPDGKDPLQLDLEQLVRRRGILPEDFRPARLGPGRPAVPVPPVSGSSGLARLARASGRLVLAYLRERSDARCGPAWEGVLRALGDDLAAADARHGAETLPRLVDLLTSGGEDEAARSVHACALGILLAELMAGPATGGDAPHAEPEPRSPSVGALAGAPSSVGGASLRIEAGGEGAGAAVIVTSVPARSAAHAAGLRRGDRLLAVNGRAVDAGGLQRIARAFRDGGQLSLVLMRRDGQRETLTLPPKKE